MSKIEILLLLVSVSIGCVLTAEIDGPTLIYSPWSLAKNFARREESFDEDGNLQGDHLSVNDEISMKLMSADDALLLLVRENYDGTVVNGDVQIYIVDVKDHADSCDLRSVKELLLSNVSSIELYTENYFEFIITGTNYTTKLCCDNLLNRISFYYAFFEKEVNYCPLHKLRSDSEVALLTIAHSNNIVVFKIFSKSQFPFKLDTNKFKSFGFSMKRQKPLIVPNNAGTSDKFHSTNTFFKVICPYFKAVTDKYEDKSKIDFSRFSIIINSILGLSMFKIFN